MANKILTDDEVEQEIERLQRSPHVALARRERQIRTRRRQYLYNLRQMEKKGKELEAAGLSLEMLEDGFEADFCK